MTDTLIQNYSISDITASMRRMMLAASIDPNVRQLAIQIVRDNPVEDIYNWVKQNVAYISDPTDLELFTSPSRMVKDYQAGHRLAEDCDGIAMFTAALLKDVGINARVVLIDAKGGGLSHASAQYWSDRLHDWIYCDPTANVPVGWYEKNYQMVVI